MGKFRVGGAFAVVALVISGASPAAAQSAGLLGNTGGIRPALANLGITLNVNDSENLLGNLAGGVKPGATLQGLTTAVLTVDTGKAFNLPGGTFNISALQIHGRGLSPYYLDDLQTANGNEAEDATRLWELWFDQAFFNNKFDVKIGQQSIDNEFLVSADSGLFVNTAAGWPLLPSDDMYGGGPAYPLSSLGLRLRGEPTGNATILAGVFDDNPGGGAFALDAQALDHGGTRFNLNTGALFIAELQYATKMAGLPGTYKIGGWLDTGTFPDQELASVSHHGNDSLYGVADQTVWQSAGAQNVNIFARIMAAPDDRNLIEFSLNGGITIAAPFPARANDTAGIDVDLGRVGRRAASGDRAAGLPARGTEELIELTYQAQATPWLILQPDLQYVVNPGAGVIDPDDASHLLRNAFVAGLRAVVTF
jgi:porin